MFIIEHPTRGTLREIGIEPDGSVKHYFSWSGLRNDPDKAWQFRTLDDARAVFFGIPEKIRNKCEIRDGEQGYAVVS